MTRPTSLPGAVRVGRIGGVPLLLHWSVLIVTVPIAWDLTDRALPVVSSGRPAWALVAGGTVVLALLAHEVAHAAVARHEGTDVDSITLWSLGGVPPPHGGAGGPAAELRIAGAGPMVSLLLGSAAWGVTLLLEAAGAPGPVVAGLGWAAASNLLLGVVHLLPGPPLDGGRMLRAALWAWRGDRLWATVAAARGGRGLGLVLIAAGLLMFVMRGGYSGTWLALVGWFLVVAAAAEEDQARSEIETGE